MTVSAYNDLDSVSVFAGAKWFAMQCSFALCLIVALPTISLGQCIPATHPTEPTGNSTASTAVWTETNWESWYQSMATLVNSGVDPEGIYWLLRHDVDLLSTAEPLLATIDFPPPPGGVTPGPGGGGLIVNGELDDPGANQLRSTSGGDQTIESCYMPAQWESLIRLHGIDPATFPQGISVGVPPGWLGPGLVALGRSLRRVPHPYARAAAGALEDAGAVLSLWWAIFHGEDDDEEDDE